MRTWTALSLIAGGYLLALGCGAAAVALNEMRVSEEMSQSSGGMVAFGDMVLFVFVSGVVSLVPTWFLLRLSVEKIPRVTLACLLAIAATAPASWLLVMTYASSPAGSDLPPVAAELVGSVIVFAAIPRVVAGPAIMAIDGATIFLMKQRTARLLLAAAVLADLVPLTLFIRHMAHVSR